MLAFAPEVGLGINVPAAGPRVLQPVCRQSLVGEDCASSVNFPQEQFVERALVLMQPVVNIFMCSVTYLFQFFRQKASDL